MTTRKQWTPLRYAGVVLLVAFATMISVVWEDLRFGGHLNQVSAVYGVALAILLLGGFRYLSAIFIGSLLAHWHAGAFLASLSLPLGLTTSAALGAIWIRAMGVSTDFERIRDTLLVFLCGAVISVGLGVAVQTVLLSAVDPVVGWDQSFRVLLGDGLSAVIGTVIVLPFLLTWGQRSSAHFHASQFFEALLWFSTLIVFAWVTFKNWAPTDVLLYPMELAIFPVMAWAALRFGPRGVTAGVLILALLAAWALLPIFGGQSPNESAVTANVWLFVGIVSITSSSLAAVMTELRRREAQISENENRLRAFTEALPDVAFVFSADGVIEDVFAANPIIESNHRLPEGKQVKGASVRDLMDAENADKFLETIRAALSERSLRTLEYSLLSNERGLHWFEARVTPMTSEASEAQRVVWVAYDITARKSIESALKDRENELRLARDAADAASAAKGDYLATMSHEIRTPMNAVIGYTDLLLKSGLDPAQREQLAIVKRSGRALLELINSILDYSKIESGFLELEADEFYIEQVLSEAVECVLPLALEKGLRLNYDFSPKLAECYRGDGPRIRQILVNLTSNAVKFTSDGFVALGVEPVADESDGALEALHFVVQDSGCGISEEEKAQLFQPFRQGRSGPPGAWAGTGLGLAISHRLVEKMQGRIWVESELQQGTRIKFVIRLPRVEAADRQAEPVREASESGKDTLKLEFAEHYPLNILICDGNTDNRWMIRELLEALGYLPILSQNGAEALAQARSRKFDVFLVEPRLPDRDGLEWIQAIRAGQYDFIDPRQYIVAVSASAMSGEQEKFLSAGVDDFLSKPIEVPNLKKALQKACRRV